MCPNSVCAIGDGLSRDQNSAANRNEEGVLCPRYREQVDRQVRVCRTRNVKGRPHCFVAEEVERRNGVRVGVLICRATRAFLLFPFGKRPTGHDLHSVSNFLFTATTSIALSSTSVPTTSLDASLYSTVNHAAGLSHGARVRP